MYDTFNDVPAIKLGNEINECMVQYNIGDIIRRFLNSNESIEFVRYKEKPNKVKFTCMDEEWIYFGCLEIIASTGMMRKIERYPRYKKSKDYKDLINELYIKRGKNQKQIAHRLNLSQATISRILNS